MNHLQNGNTENKFGSNYDLGASVLTKSSSTTAITLNKSINRVNQWQIPLNGFVNGNNNNNNNKSTALNQTKSIPLYVQSKSDDNSFDAFDYDDDEKTNSIGLAHRPTSESLSSTAPYDGLSTTSRMKNALNGSSSELRIDEKNISLHLNNPFVTHFAVLPASNDDQTAAFKHTNDMSYYGGKSSQNTILPQSASASQINNVIQNHSQQFKSYGQLPIASGGDGGVSDGNNDRIEYQSGDYDRINDIDSNTLRRPKRPHSIAGVLSASPLLSSTVTSSTTRLSSQLLANNEQLTIGAMVTTVAANTTMTYSNSYFNPNPNNNGTNINSNNSNGNNSNNKINNNNNNNVGMLNQSKYNAASMSNSSLNNVNNGSSQNVAQRVFSQPQNNEPYTTQQNQNFPPSTHGQSFINSPSRLTTNRQTTQDFSLYIPPSLSTTLTIAAGSSGVNCTIANNNTSNSSVQKRQPPPPVQRRSHSTPRSLQSNVTMSMTNPSISSIGNANISNNNGTVTRPRSLDRATLNTLAALSNTRPPPIPPSRRFSQQTMLQQQTQQFNKNSPNSVQYPATSSSSYHRSASSSTTSSGMRQSVTFHGQLNRHTTNANSSNSYNSFSNSKDVSDNKSMGTRRKVDRPVSFAYGTMPDQSYLENQLRMYSEQLRTITESVRKYSEQAKILSEMKRQQQQQNRPFELASPQKGVSKKSNTGQSDSNIYSTGVYVKPKQNEDAPTPSHQLRLFLDSIRHTMKDCDDEQSEPPPPAPITSNSNPIQKLSFPKSKTESCGISSKTITEAKTPSDQLRQFLDAIRSNQLPEESAADQISAADQFSKFKEKMEHSRSKSTPNFNQYQISPNVQESFSQVSDNLRIMNEDLEALAAASPKKDLFKSKSTTNTATTVNPDISKPEIMDFNQILDSFSHLTNSSHSMETIDYLRKCSEALRQTSNQLRNSSRHSYDSPENSSCSTTPGSIREAVQNLLQQPRNGVQIMDDRMKLFIDILDTQSKFSQVNCS